MNIKKHYINWFRIWKEILDKTFPRSVIETSWLQCRQTSWQTCISSDVEFFFIQKWPQCWQISWHTCISSVVKFFFIQKSRISKTDISHIEIEFLVIQTRKWIPNTDWIQWHPFTSDLHTKLRIISGVFQALQLVFLRHLMNHSSSIWWSIFTFMFLKWKLGCKFGMVEINFLSISCFCSSFCT